MNNPKSIYFIVLISLIVGILHFAIGPEYNGIFKIFITGYLIDLLLPMNVYLLLQISFRKKMSVNKSRIIGAISTFLLGLTVEVLQFNKIQFFGQTYDAWDIVMYATGVIFGILIDLLLIEKFERVESNDKINNNIDI